MRLPLNIELLLLHVYSKEPLINCYGLNLNVIMDSRFWYRKMMMLRRIVYATRNYWPMYLVKSVVIAEDVACELGPDLWHKYHQNNIKTLQNYNQATHKNPAHLSSPSHKSSGLISRQFWPLVWHQAVLPPRITSLCFKINENYFDSVNQSRCQSGN